MSRMKRMISIGLASLMSMNLLAGAVAGAEVTGNGAGTGSVLLSALGTSAATFSPTYGFPINGSRGVAIDTKFTLNFGRAVKFTEQTISITNMTMTPAQVTHTIELKPAQGVDPVWYGDLVLTPTTGGPLEYNTTYNVLVPAGTFIDQDGKESEEIRYSFTTVSSAMNTAPTLMDYRPSGSRLTLDSSNKLQFMLQFNEPVTKGGGNIYIKRASTNTVVEQIPVGNAVLDPTDSTKVTFTASSLQAGDRYYILIDQGAFIDSDWFPFAGMSSGQNWTFSVLGPNTTSTKQYPTGTGVAITENLQLTFNRIVYPNIGYIELTGGGTTQRIDVTSTAVTGGDSNIITIKPSTLIANTTYTVKVPSAAFYDSDSLQYPTIGSTLTWSFTTGTTTSSALTLSSLSPSDGSTGVAINSSLTMTFNRDVALRGTNGGITLRKSGTSTSYPISVAVSSSNARQVIITPTQNLDYGSSYYIEVPNTGSTGIQDKQNSAISYAGLTGTKVWTFSTLVQDKTAPVIQTSQMYSNSIIRLQYSKPLDSTVAPLTSSFAVTVNGENRALSSINVSGDSVYVYLDTGVAVGQVVRISYSGGVRPIRDLYQNNAATFSSRDVTNSIDSALPKPSSGYVSGSTLVLTFKESLSSLSSSSAYNQFSVTVGGYSRNISSISQSGSTLTLYLSSSVSNGDVVTVSYSPGSNPIKDYRGQQISEFSNFFVRNSYDTVPPVLQSVEGTGNKVVLTYNEALNPERVPMKSQFSILANKLPIYVTAIDISANVVTLTLASSFTNAQTVTVSYVPNSSGLSDLSGNLAGYINLSPLNYRDGGQYITSGAVRGDVVNLVFTGTLKYSSSTLPISAFGITVDQTSRGIQSATVTGNNTVTLKLASPVTSGQNVVFSYSGTGGLSDSNNSVIPAFSGIVVQNITDGNSSSGSTSTPLPSYLSMINASEFGKNVYALNSTAMTSTSAVSKSGQMVNKYVVDSAKIGEGYAYLTSANQDRLLAVDIPSTEKMGMVAIPLQPLVDAYSKTNKSSIAVRYGGVYYELPLSSIPFSDLSRSLNIFSFTSAQLLVQMESVSASTAGSMSGTTSAYITPIELPVELTVSAVTTAGVSVPITVDGEFRIRTSKAVAPLKSSLVKYDMTKRTISFMPTKMVSDTTGTVFIGKGSNLTVAPGYGTVSFSDVEKHWAKAAINELASKLIVDGHSTSRYNPNNNITRSEFAVYIAKGLGLEGDAASASKFKDVPSSSAATASIGAAVKAGIITGFSDGTFQPNSNITREQMAIMMVRALSAGGTNISLNATKAQTVKSFKDRGQIHSTSLEMVAKAVQEGIMQGTSSTTFNPKGTASRAEAAVMLKRVLTKLGYL